MRELAKTYIYHITPLDNLAKILDCGALRSYNTLDRTNVQFTNMSYNTVQDRRAKIHIPCGSGGTLHNYVPFYFAPRSPMLYAIKSGNVPGHTAGQTPIIHLVSTIETIQAHNLPFVFTDGHGIMALTQFYTDLADLDFVDWTIMRAEQWADTNSDGDRKRRRQAEFLIYNECPWAVIRGIGTINESIKEQAEHIIHQAKLTTPVIVRQDWYYK
jgi:hypothetical protein